MKQKSVLVNLSEVFNFVPHDLFVEDLAAVNININLLAHSFTYLTNIKFSKSITLKGILKFYH